MDMVLMVQTDMLATRGSDSRWPVRVVQGRGGAGLVQLITRVFVELAESGDKHQQHNDYKTHAW